VLVGVLALGFALVMLVPADPAALLAGDTATPEAIERIRHDMGLDQPKTEQFARYLLRLAHGEFGYSLLNHAPVLEQLAVTVGPTLELLLAALALAVPVGIGLGAIGAAWRDRWIDRLVMAFAVTGMSAPVFMTGLLLINVVGVWMGLLPVQGRGGPLYTLTGLAHVIMPALTLALMLIGPIARMTRNSMLDVAGLDFIRTARSKGIGERRVMINHVLRNALVPTVNLIGLQAGYLLGGIVVTETVFAWPGLGRLAVSAISSQDTPMAQGTILFLALSFIFINLVVDLISGMLDPRARRS
jgi:ABC-type dipeptide/oligopeptide/nickel transport system permease component